MTEVTYKRNISREYPRGTSKYSMQWHRHTFVHHGAPIACINEAPIVCTEVLPDRNRLYLRKFQKGLENASLPISVIFPCFVFLVVVVIKSYLCCAAIIFLELAHYQF